jgi:NAD+ synthase (glutamine-hydrolysing)
MDFRSPYRHGFVRVAATTLRTALADPPRNAESVLRVARECQDEGVALVVFPELTLTGYSIEDIVLQDTVLDAVEAALLDVVAGSADLAPVLVVGAPLRHRHRIYNCEVPRCSRTTTRIGSYPKGGTGIGSKVPQVQSRVPQ